jgi:hypothetical protein
MILLPRDLMTLAAKAVNKRLAHWAETLEISDEGWDKLYDTVSANLDRLQWLVQMTTEDLLSKTVTVEQLPDRLYFKVLQRDFEWDWSCDLNSATYWPAGLNYGVEAIIAKG